MYEGLTSLTAKSSLVCEPNGRPVRLKRTLSALLQTTTIENVYDNDKVKATVAGLTRLEREIDLQPGAFCFDNNFMGCWLPIAPQLPLKANESFVLRTFHPSSLQQIPLTVTPKPPAKIRIGGEEIECYECEIAPIKNTFWISTDGRFVRAKQGNLVIELEQLTPQKSEEKE